MCNEIPYIMIKSFRSSDLKRFWEKNDPSGVRPDWVKKVRVFLSRLDVSHLTREMDVSGFGFHALKEDRKGDFACKVSRNWRLTFRWEGEDAVDVDLEDYHDD